MTIRSAIALVYVIAAGAVALISGPGAKALAGEIAVLAVFEPGTGEAQPARTRTRALRVHWELDDLPAYLTGLDKSADMNVPVPTPRAAEVAVADAVQ